jgi:hypothetical protein
LSDFGLSPDRLPRAAGSSQRRGYPVAAFLELFERWLTASPAWDDLSAQVSHDPNLPSVGPETHSGTDAKTHVSQQVSQPFSERKTPPETLAHLKPAMPAGPAFGAAVTAGHSKAHGLLADLVAVIQAAKGLHPAGHPDCQWNEEYPSEYSGALDYLDDWQPDDGEAFVKLARLVYEIESEAERGTPLQSKGQYAQQWRDPFWPAAFKAARAYVREESERRTGGSSPAHETTHHGINHE